MEIILVNSSELYTKHNTLFEQYVPRVQTKLSLDKTKYFSIYNHLVHTLNTVL